MRAIIHISAILFAVLIFSGCSSKQEIYRDMWVVVEVQKPMLWPINPHGLSIKTITTQGLSFKGVRGSAPYYLFLPGDEKILFITEYPEDSTVFHIVDLKTHAHDAIDGGHSKIGDWIGSKRKPGERYSICIQQTGDKSITLIEQEDHWEEMVTLNLIKKIIEPER